MEDNHKRYACTVLCLGMIGLASYLELNGGSGGFIWLGAFIAFLCAVD